MKAQYDEPIEEDEDVYTVQEWKDTVDAGGFIDYDGMGSPAKDGMKDGRAAMWVYPSKLNIPADATHIVWYNR